MIRVSAKSLIPIQDCHYDSTNDILILPYEKWSQYLHENGLLGYSILVRGETEIVLFHSNWTKVVSSNYYGYVPARRFNLKGKEIDSIGNLSSLMLMVPKND